MFIFCQCPICREKWKLDSIFEDSQVLWPPLTKQDSTLKKNYHLAFKNGMNHIMGFVFQKCFNDVCRILLFYGRYPNNALNIAILPVKLLFQQIS